MRLWAVESGSFAMLIVLAATEERAAELGREAFRRQSVDVDESNFTAEILRDDLTSEWASDVLCR